MLRQAFKAWIEEKVQNISHGQKSRVNWLRSKRHKNLVIFRVCHNTKIAIALGQLNLQDWTMNDWKLADWFQQLQLLQLRNHDAVKFVC